VTKTLGRPARPSRSSIFLLCSVWSEHNLIACQLPLPWTWQCRTALPWLRSAAFCRQACQGCALGCAPALRLTLPSAGTSCSISSCMVWSSCLRRHLVGAFLDRGSHRIFSPSPSWESRHWMDSRVFIFRGTRGDEDRRPDGELEPDWT
jgi:hypothetical protein